MQDVLTEKNGRQFAREDERLYLPRCAYADGMIANGSSHAEAWNAAFLLYPRLYRNVVPMKLPLVDDVDHVARDMGLISKCSARSNPYNH